MYYNLLVSVVQLVLVRLITTKEQQMSNFTKATILKTDKPRLLKLQKTLSYGEGKRWAGEATIISVLLDGGLPGNSVWQTAKSLRDLSDDDKIKLETSGLDWLYIADQIDEIAATLNGKVGRPKGEK
jgi:hypothetical protein